MAPELIILIGVILVGGVAQGIVIRLDLVPGLAVPLDAGRCLGGRRIFGANKTLRGALVMIGATTIAGAVLLSLAPPVTPAPSCGRAGLGALMGLAYILAELPNSFVKRRLGIAPGAQSHGWPRWVQYVADQADSVVGVVLLLWWLLGLTAGEVCFLAVVGVVVHAAFDLVLHSAGVKEGITTGEN